ncbi:myoblast growth factor receptor egl-15-like [Octopus vulgaris]|uniref:receptor protein-tyrosine kinase n=1 Tax=Octopus vulgaris TaxID=6645 RepID=A0AA36B3Z0_OCTVU|nr:myoblast growth factor receptor egl-15-like [Octopus vulgaris]
MLIPKKYWISLLLCFCLVVLALCERSPKARKKAPRKPQWKKRSPPKKGESLVTVAVKKNLKLDCSANGIPKPNITWTRDGDDIKRIPNLKVKFQKYTLTVQNVRMKDSGNYTCRVSNNLGTLSFTFNVIVAVQMKFDIIPPSNLTVSVGKSATFICRVKPHNSGKIQWLFQGSTRDGRKFLPTSANPEVLHIQNVTYDDAGKYMCLVGGDRNIQDASAWLTVVKKDEFDRVTMPSLIVSTWKSPNSRNYASEMGKKPHANETNQQREEYPALVSIWTIYIIVGSVSGGVLFIGLITIIVAVCCQKENTGTYKSTNV